MKTQRSYLPTHDRMLQASTVSPWCVGELGLRGAPEGVKAFGKLDCAAIRGGNPETDP